MMEGSVRVGIGRKRESEEREWRRERLVDEDESEIFFQFLGYFLVGGIV